MKQFTSVYRFQFNQNFTFQDAIAVLPYLKDLGVEAVYASPLLQATSGSTHGYDVTDPTRIWDELGESFELFCQEIKRQGMGLLFDLVANHMAVSDENPWWRDVCEKGEGSNYAHYFDIDWKRGEGKVIIPILAEKQDLVKGHALFCHWKEAAGRINYRRFFDINTLAALRVEESDVFEAYHKFVFALIDAGHVDGLRVDHPDGLYDPKGYFEKLKERCDYVVAEKILEENESVPLSWPVDGTVGYDFLNDLTNLYIDSKNEEKFTEIYESYIGKKCDIEEMLFDAKRMIARDYFTSEVKALDESEELIILLSCFPVYRSYLPDDGKEYVEKAFAMAEQRRPDLDFSSLRKKFTGDFAQKFQQLSPPIMAKGLEDTLCYRYNRFVAVNEVGGHPKNFGITPEEFHKRNLVRAKKGLITVSTHDTKRSHDVRMRLAALSEMPDRFAEELKKVKSGCDPNMTYFLYQNLLGAWPISDERFSAYAIKAAREAKVHTAWVDHNAAYENSLKLDCDVSSFAKELDEYGRQNTLSSIPLFLGSPGIIDVYRGSETWDFSLVDPDNRRPITFGEGYCEKRELYRKGLKLRHDHPDLFLKGEYIPLETSSDRIVAFARRYGKMAAIFIGGRFFAQGELQGEVFLPFQLEGKRALLVDCGNGIVSGQITSESI